jgi:hypothetical protein
MRKIVGLFFLFALFGCASYKYEYVVKLNSPVSSSFLGYWNDTFSISFDFTAKGLNFTLFNKSNDGIKINWDEVSISENGVAKRVVHKETGMTRINDLQPPTTIPPKSSLNDFVVPTDNIMFVPVYGRQTMVVTDSYPIYDYGNKAKSERIMKSKGKRITLYLPFYIRNTFCSKTYAFTIVDVEKKKMGSGSKVKK